MIGYCTKRRTQRAVTSGVTPDLSFKRDFNVRKRVMSFAPRPLVRAFLRF
jgi:hypothetical protein